MKLCKTVILGLALSLAPLGLAQAADQPNPDPWEGFNRAMYRFNDTLDRYALKPIAKGYRAVVPDPVERGVSNVFGNLGDVGTLVNNVLQLKLHNAASDLARITMNSTFGLAGIFDLATPLGLEKHDEDFGQTLGYWGVPSGNYLVLPFFGPSDVRDGIGLIPDGYIDPVWNIDDIPTRNSLYGLRVIDKRASLLKVENIISGDRYLFIRDAYLQRRQYLINDGHVDTKFDDNDF